MTTFLPKVFKGNALEEAYKINVKDSVGTVSYPKQTGVWKYWLP